jgi:uncharacterized membrane protein YdjX (TVP38/TMEM64 family)
MNKEKSKKWLAKAAVVGLLGLVVGTVTVSFASTVGATPACVVSRFLLRDRVQGKFGKIPQI